MNRVDAERWARRWIADWNTGDLEAVLRGFDESVAFTSPRALAVVGVPTVHGKAALRAYWTKALASIGSLRFTLDRIAFDPASAELVIFYERSVDGRADRAAEALRFGAAGCVVRAEVLHGVVPV